MLERRLNITLRHLFNNSMSGTLILMSGRSRIRLLIGLAAMIMGLVIIPAGSVGANDMVHGLLSHAQQAQGNPNLEVWFSPESGGPGDQVTLYLKLSTDGNLLASPELEILLPGSLSLEMNDLPVGASFNIQSNLLIWRPILDSSEDSIFLSVPLTVSSVDLNKPEQIVPVTLHSGDSVTEYSAQFWAGLPPQATIKFGPPQAAVGQAVQLIAEISGPEPNIQNWDLGDGRTIAVNNPEVIYSTPGVYLVSLRASNPIGSVEATGVLTISAQPIARFTVSDPALAIGETLTLVDHSGGQQPLAYSWDFGDGTGSTELKPIHQYLTPGSYQVHLTVSNELGQSDTFQTIAVGQRPTADFVVDRSPSAGRLFELQAFFDSSVTAIHWDMGDGNYYEGERVNHVYWAAGDYLVSATFISEFGETVVQQWIQVGPGTLYLYLPLIRFGGDGQLVQSVPAVNGSDQPAPADPEAEASVSAEAQSIRSLEMPEELQPAEQLFAYINEARQINNLAPLQMVFELNVAAQAHTNDMAKMGFTGHEGSDGSTPALRIQRSTYAGGYAGEATAWGMQSAIDPVQFWLTSPEHRPIILNPLATEVGVGFSVNFGAPSVWYWTAEFASMNLPPVHVPIPPPAEASGQTEDGAGTDSITTPVEKAPPTIQLLGPPQGSEFLLANENYLIFTWSWPEPLLANQRFVVYLNSQGRIYQIGAVQAPQSGTQYQYKVLVTDVPVAPGTNRWVVRLEDSVQGQLLSESPYWPLTIRRPE